MREPEGVMIPAADDGVFFHGDFLGCPNCNRLFEIGDRIAFEVVERVEAPREGVRTIPVHVACPLEEG